MLHILLHIDYYVSGIRGRVIQLFVMRGEHYTSIFTNTQIQMQKYKIQNTITEIQLDKYTNTTKHGTDGVIQLFVWEASITDGHHQHIKGSLHLTI